MLLFVTKFYTKLGRSASNLNSGQTFHSLLTSKKKFDKRYISVQNRKGIFAILKAKDNIDKRTDFARLV